MEITCSCTLKIFIRHSIKFPFHPTPMNFTDLTQMLKIASICKKGIMNTCYYSFRGPKLIELKVLHPIHFSYNHIIQNFLNDKKKRYDSSKVRVCAEHKLIK